MGKLGGKVLTVLFNGIEANLALIEVRQILRIIESEEKGGMISYFRKYFWIIYGFRSLNVIFSRIFFPHPVFF